jgi:predicted DNA-binding protein (MmcQ/YjbR family)
MNEALDAMQRLKRACAAMPGAVLDHPWGQDTYKVGGKMFAAFSGIGDACTFKASFEEQAALIQDPEITVAAYIGHRGWVTVQIKPETVEMAIDLMEASWRHVVAGLPKRVQRELDDQSTSG